MAHVTKHIATRCESTQGLLGSTLKLPNKSKKHHRLSMHKTHAQIKRLPQKAQQRLYHKLTQIFDKFTGKNLPYVNFYKTLTPPKFGQDHLATNLVVLWM